MIALSAADVVPGRRTRALEAYVYFKRLGQFEQIAM